MHCYIAKVTSIDGRRVKARSNIISDEAGLIAPLQWGHFKAPVPDVGDSIMVFCIDELNQHRFYLPVQTLKDTDGDDETQFFLGKDATEQAVLGNVLVSLLTDLITQIKLITVICAAPSNPSSVPVNAAAFDIVAQQLETALSEVVKLK